MHAEFGGEVGDRARAENAGVGRAPGAVCLQVLLAAAVDVVDAAVQDEFGGAALDLAERHFVEQRDGILVELAPADGIEVAKQIDAVVIPAPPDVARERPEALLCRGDETVEGAGFADNRGDLVGGIGEHADFVVAEDAGFLGLHHENALQDAAIDEGHAEEGVVLLFAGVLEVFVAGVAAGVVDGDGTDLLGDQAGESLVERHAKRADAAGVEAERCGQNEVGAIGLKQIGGADVGAETRGDQRDHVHQRVGGFASILREAR